MHLITWRLWHGPELIWAPIDTATFVDDVFRVIRTKSYLPGAPPADSLPTSPVTAPLGSSNTDYDPKAPAFPTNGQASIAGQRRKRSFNEDDGNGPGSDRNIFNDRNGAGERSFKHPRRGGLRGGRPEGPASRGGRPGPIGRTSGQGPDGSGANMQALSQPPTPAFPGMPPAPPYPFDPNDPMAALMAMQAIGFPPIPVLPGGLPPLPFSPTGFGPDAMSQALPGIAAQPARKNGERCKDYDEKGFCALGNTCPYDHGSDRIIVPGQNEGNMEVHSYIWESRTTDWAQSMIQITRPFSPTSRDRILMPPTVMPHSTALLTVNPGVAAVGGEVARQVPVL